MAIQYSQNQIYAHLLDQGYNPERAKAIAASIGDIEKQDSSIMPDLVEGSTYAAVAAGLANKGKAADKILKTKTPGAKNLLEPTYAKNLAKSTFSKWFAPMLAANAASVLYPALSGNNYYDQASLEQLGLNVAGQLGGGILGEKFATSVAKGLGNTAKTKVFSPAVRRFAAGVVGPKLASRALGGTIGSLAGPIGGILGSVVGGYLLSKLAPNENEKFIEPNKGIDGSTLALLGAGAALASPIGRPVRKLFSDNPVTAYVSKQIKPVTDIASNYKKVFIDPLGNHVAESTVVKLYRKNLADEQRKILDNYIRSGKQPGDRNTLAGTAFNIKDTIANINAFNRTLDNTIEDLGEALGSMYKKRQQR